MRLPRRRPKAVTVRYGDAPRQRLELSRPAGPGPAPVVVAIHGGFWSNEWDLDLMRPLLRDLVAAGWAVANIEYRSVGDEGGGWPGTFDDVAAAVDALADLDGLDLSRVVALGHSAGGHLAVLLAGRANPRVRVAGVVGQAAVLDLALSADHPMGAGPTAAFLGGRRSEVPDRYALASPIERVPIGVPVHLLHSADDVVVSVEHSRRYYAAASAAGDLVTFTELDGPHFALINPRTPSWTAVLAALDRLR